VAGWAGFAAAIPTRPTLRILHTQEPSSRRVGKERHKKECGTIMNKIHTQSLHLQKGLEKYR
jgi:hypothetical protein